MKRDYKLYLNDIDDSIKLVECYIQGISEKQFLESVDIQDKVIRRMEIIGEAISNLPLSLKQKNPSNLWAELSEFRNFIVHHYFEASLSRIWKTIKEKLPLFKKELQHINLV